MAFDMKHMVFFVLKWKGVEVVVVVASHVIWFVFKKTHSLNNKLLASLFAVRATYSCLLFMCLISLSTNSQLPLFKFNASTWICGRWHKIFCTSIFFGVEPKSAYKSMSCTHYQITFISLQYLLPSVCKWKNGWIEEFL